MLETLTVGAVAFASTNVDDIVLLAVWFAQAGRRVSSIVLGQFVGIGALVLISVVGALTALVLPEGWIPLIGVVPVALGIKALVDKGGDDDSGAAPAATGVLAVALVTMANGADNIGVYVPLFASEPDSLPWYVAIFAVGTAVWCALGYALVSHPAAGPRLQRYGHHVLPWVLIAIGLHVLFGLMA